MVFGKCPEVPLRGLPAPDLLLRQDPDCGGPIQHGVQPCPHAPDIIPPSVHSQRLPSPKLSFPGNHYTPHSVPSSGTISRST